VGQLIGPIFRDSLLVPSSGTTYCSHLQGQLIGPIFRDNLLVPSSRVKNPKIKLVSLYRVYRGQSVGIGKFSVALVGGSGLEGGVKCYQYCFEERHSGREKPQKV